jgi:hypothetical protein
VRRSPRDAAGTPDRRLVRRAEARWGAPDEFLALVADRDAEYRLTLREVVHGWQIGASTETEDDGLGAVSGCLFFDVRIYLTTIGDFLASCDCRPGGSSRSSRGFAGIWGRHFGSLDDVGVWLAEVRSTLDDGRAPEALDRAAGVALAHAHGLIGLLDLDAARQPASTGTA